MLRIIAMCFDRYLATPSVSETQPRHSRALWSRLRRRPRAP